MIWIASTSISWRTSARGQPPPTTCSLRFSPAPRPRVNRPSDEDLQRRGLLRHDRRVVPEGRAGHVGHQRDAAGGLRGRAERHPGVRRVAHLVQPREVVVAADGEVEARRLRTHHVADQVLRPGLLGHHRVAQLHAHGARLPRAGCAQPAQARSAWSASRSFVFPPVRSSAPA